MNANLILFEDEYSGDLRPITLTRPAFAVTCACCNLYELAGEVSERISYVVRDYLAATTAHAYRSAPPGEGPTLFLNASLAPDVRYIPRLRGLLEQGAAWLCPSGQRVAAAVVPAGTALPQKLASEGISRCLLALGLPVDDDVQLKTFDYPFHVIDAYHDLFPANLEWRIKKAGLKKVRPGVYAGADVKIAETAVFHVEDGPIVLDAGVSVMDFTYLFGPVYIGPGSRIIERSSIKEFTSVGHTCKVGGEVEASVIEPYTNKQHHGFLGHAYVGSWVNLGAGTSNSDLKNTYGEIRFQHDGRALSTGMQFLGCVIGDYAKSAINTSIFTGKTVGVASMLYGYVGQNVPSFVNYARSFGQVTEVVLDQAIVTQKRMFSRRKVEQTPEDVQLLKDAFTLTREERVMSAELPIL